MTVSEARAALPQIIERGLAGEDVTLTRHGTPVAVVVRPDTLRVRRTDDVAAGATRLWEVLEQARRSPLDAQPTLSEARAEELIADLREARSHR
jgi:antitoxin (DNA-binding transcriptional repressor) of toxin-antitoxin stability system